jgi:hypothetical protein
MNTFANAVKNQSARTTNGMAARKSTAKSTVDLFYKIGASRGKNVIPDFVAALTENPNHALRIAAWSRDVRGGAGERQIFRDILLYLEKNDPDAAKALAKKVPELGRWDDLLVFKGAELKHFAFDLIRDALDAGNGLAAKWMPRKGEVAVELRTYFGWTPKFYRKRLVELTNVVETQMCAKDWDNINFNHVPSVASARYKKAFQKHTTKYAEWAAALASGDPNAKVNAAAVYPYDVLKGLIPSGYNTMTKSELDHVKAQWYALPNYVGEANILPLVDVSGSMTCKAGGYDSKSTVTCLDVSISLGLYLADKNKGKFKDTFLTFSTNPQLLHLKGDIVQKIEQMNNSQWAMSTNLEAAFKLILKTAIDGKVPPEEMPSAVLILSDMQFNRCVTRDDTAMQMIEREFVAAGYEVPQVVFWNLNAYDNAPVSYDKSGAALVSGFSPAILKSVLSTDFDKFSPENVMLETIMNPRYDI